MTSTEAFSSTASQPADPLVTLGAELRRQLATKRDMIADTRRVTFCEPDDGERGDTTVCVDLDTGVEEFEITQHAHGQIATHLDIPTKLYRRLHGDHPDLLGGLVNGLFQREPSKRMLRTIDGTVRAFLSDRYRPRDNWDLLDQAVLPVLRDHPGTVEFKECSLSETRMYVKIVLPGHEQPITPREGDVLRGGLIVKNSEVGAGSLVIAPYTDVLVCRNGMIHTEYGQAQRHVGKRIDADDEAAREFFSDETIRLDDEAFFAKCRDVVRAVMDESVFQAIARQMRDLAEIRIDGSPVDAVQILADRHGLTEAESGSILNALIDGGSRSAWGYVNAITRTARDLDDVDRRAELEDLAGQMAARPELVAV